MSFRVELQVEAAGEDGSGYPDLGFLKIEAKLGFVSLWWHWGRQGQQAPSIRGFSRRWQCSLGFGYWLYIYH